MTFKKIYFSLCFLLLMSVSIYTRSQTVDSILPDFKFYKLEDVSPFIKSNIEPDKKSIFILFDTSCSHCQHEVESIGSRYIDFKGVHFYLISMDVKSSIEKFMKTYGKALNGKKNVTVLQDSNSDFVTKFKPTEFPALYVYSEKQSLIKYFGGQHNADEVIAVIQ